MPADLPPPIAIHAPVPVSSVKTATATGFHSNRTNQGQRTNPAGDLGGQMGFTHYTSPVFMGGSNANKKKHSNRKHVSKNTKNKAKRKSK